MLSSAMANYLGGKRIRSIFTRDPQSGPRVFVFVFLSVLLMVADERLVDFAAVRAKLSVPLTPIYYVINLPTQLLERTKDLLGSRFALVSENRKLKAELLLLRSQLQRLNAIETENRDLKALLHSSKQIKGKALVAGLLAVATEPFINQVILDKGTKENVYEGQAVLDENGLMGQVVQTGKSTSRVLLITDPHSGIAVRNVRNGLRAITMGDSYSGKLRLMYVPKTADIKVGDLFMTSGLGDHFPEGHPVGKVLSFTKDPAKQFATIFLQPIANLNSSRQVLLVWNPKNAS